MDLRKARIHVGSTDGSSVYFIKYVLVIVVYCCRILGSGFGSSYYRSGDSTLNDQIDGLSKWLIDSIVIGWCRYIWWLNYTYDVVDGSNLKIYETWSLEEGIRSFPSIGRHLHTSKHIS